MESKAIIGVSIIFFTYALFAWALGRFLNKRAKKETNEWQNFIAGAWRMALILTGLIVFGYFMGK